MEYVNYRNKSMIQNQERWADKIIEWMTLDKILEGMVYIEKATNEEDDMNYLITYMFTSNKSGMMPWYSEPDLFTEITDGEVNDCDEIFEYEDWMKILEKKTGIRFYDVDICIGSHCSTDYRYDFESYDESYENYDIVKKYIDEYYKKQEKYHAEWKKAAEDKLFDKVIAKFGNHSDYDGLSFEIDNSYGLSGLIIPHADDKLPFTITDTGNWTICHISLETADKLIKDIESQNKGD